SDKEEALYMGVWDRFKDCFRTHKKREVLEVLYTLIHGCEREKIPVSLNYYGFGGGEVLPAGVQIAVATGTAGTGAPVLTGAVAA
ncbi:hypothetical protein MJM83_33140, partial [Salmonella enterica subsp. enterica serovar Montevideo]|nr:hypothetical protein [Salmonella enterica subsp. enterica serovar Montevideo]